MEANWSHGDVFPVVVRAIETLNARQAGYAEHDAIVAELLTDSEASSFIDAARSAETPDRSPEWIAHTYGCLVQPTYYRRRIRLGITFDRQKINGKWAYRAAT